MRKLLKSRVLVILLVLPLMGWAQGWVPSTIGILDSQQQAIKPFGSFDIRFKSDGPFGKDWIYGHWWDEDTLIRHVGYREAGKWKSLPFYTTHPNSFTLDIVQYGDTMYIGGLYGPIFLDNNTTPLPNTHATILKYWPSGDSIWTSDVGMVHISDFEVSGDSLMVSGNFYLVTDSTTEALPQLTSDGGVSWTYPYANIPTTDTGFGAGPFDDVEIKDGNIYTLNNQGKDPIWDGVIRWDGSQWHSFGAGVHGTSSAVMDLIFFRDTLYIAGSFTKAENPLNPGEFIARWNGQQWESVGGGVKANQWDIWATSDGRMFFEYDDVLYCKIWAYEFGDAPLTVFAGWDGKQWCGTPFHSGDDAPKNFGFINDTLWSFYPNKNSVALGQPVSYLNYFDGDYLHGPNSICSTLGLGEDEQVIVQEDIQVFPSPASDFLYIALSQAIENAGYELLSLDGELVQSGVLAKGKNTLKIANKLSGVFLVKIETQSSVVVKKVFFEN
ncbi:T9SS type A sorting domain-containing protein [Owenweeksia hongkongensis]|uniref:T9SS type A sorting domain-containing protein n=1 Tax=Owenweeksia hongkongensis TaxID=253245 RepID=UPI003A8EC3C1